MDRLMVIINIVVGKWMMKETKSKFSGGVSFCGLVTFMKFIMGTSDITMVLMT